MTTREYLLPTNSYKLFDAFEKINVLVVGDVMIDRYLRGSVERISPEAPVPIVNLLDAENRMGGAANVALNLQALGATPYLCSVVGDDQYGNTLTNLLNHSGISSKYISHSNQRRTTVKTRIMASNQHVLRVDEEDKYDLSEEERNDYLHIIRELLDQKEIHVILFQDYNKGVLSGDVIRDIILESIKLDLPTVVDPKHNNFWAYKRATLFKPNLREIAAKVPFEIKPELSSLQKAAQYIHNQLGNQHTLITLSEKGLFIDANGGEIIPTQPRAIADVCGAGDAVISVAAIGLAIGMSMRDIALLSNIAGGQVCEKVGVAPVDKQQLFQEFTQLHGEFLI